MRSKVRLALCILWIALLVACTARAPTATPPPVGLTPLPAPTPTEPPIATATPADDVQSADVLPPADALPPGWQVDGAPRRYDRETLFDFMDGAADLYFTYGFRSLTVGEYSAGEGSFLQVEVYALASAADAYGLYTYNSYGAPVALGVDGELDPGYRLAFWQDSHYVQIVAREAVEEDVLRAFGEALASTLPTGGERPALVGALPQEGLVPGSARFFHEKMALDNLLWLGNEDVLGLGPAADGVVARYEQEGGAVDLLLVAYPDAARAEQAQAGLEGAGLETLIAVDREGRTLAAAFGSGAKEAGSAGRALVEQALANGAQ